MMHCHESVFTNGQVVYLDMATEAMPGKIVAVIFAAGGSVIYRVTWADHSTADYYEVELVDEFSPHFGVSPEDG